jgi:hypothetical protein
MTSASPEESERNDSPTRSWRDCVLLESIRPRQDVVCSVFEGSRYHEHVRLVSVSRTLHYKTIRVLRLESYIADYEIRYGAEYLYAQLGATGINHLLAQMVFSSTPTSNIRCVGTKRIRIHVSCAGLEIGCLQPYVYATFASELDMSVVAVGQVDVKIFHRVHVFPSTKFLVILCCLKVLHSYLHVRARPSKRAQG